MDAVELAAVAPYLRKTPKQYRSRVRLEALLDATATLLHERGTEAVSVTLIADEMGIAPSSIYEYVAESSQLIVAVAVRGLERIHRGFERLAAEATETTDLRALLERTARFFLFRFANEPGMRAAIRMMETDPEYAPILLDESRRNAFAIAELLAATAPDIDSNTLLDRCFVLIHLASSAARLTEFVDREEGERIFNAYIDLTIGLVPHPA